MLEIELRAKAQYEIDVGHSEIGTVQDHERPGEHAPDRSVRVTGSGIGQRIGQ